MPKNRRNSKKCRDMIRQRIEYTFRVDAYFESRRIAFMHALGEVCEKTHGRVGYEEMLQILGKDFPKAEWIPENDLKLQMIALLQQTGIPFIPDDTHIYFP